MNETFDYFKACFENHELPRQVEKKILRLLKKSDRFMEATPVLMKISMVPLHGVSPTKPMQTALSSSTMPPSMGTQIKFIPPA